MTFKLKNRDTGLVAHGDVMTGGGAAKLSVGASESIWGGYSNFRVKVPMDHEDFDKVNIQIWSASIGLFIEYSWTEISFSGLGKGAEDVDIGGWSAGTTIGGGAGVETGWLSVKKPGKQFKNVNKTEWESYQYHKSRNYGTVVNFKTGKDQLAEDETSLLRNWVNETAQGCLSP